MIGFLKRFWLFVAIGVVVVLLGTLIDHAANASVTPNITAFGASTTWGWGAGSTGYSAATGTEGFSYPYQLRHAYGWESSNMGIVGDQLTRRSSQDPYFDGTVRFEAYVTAVKDGSVSRPTAIVLWEGSNDITSTDYGTITPATEACRIAATYTQMLNAAAGAGIPVYLATLQPDQWKASDPREQTRQLLNHWIRDLHGAAGEIEVDKAVRGDTDNSVAIDYRADPHGPGPNPQGVPHLNPIGYNQVAVAVHDMITGD